MAWSLVGGIAAVLAAGGARAHELECEKTVNGQASIVVSQYPATLEYALTVRNVLSGRSTALEASDPLLEGFGFVPFVVPFTLQGDEEVTRTFDIVVGDYEQCLSIAALDGEADSRIDNVFTVGWDDGTDVCHAQVECQQPPPETVRGPRMTGGGSVFAGDLRVTHGFQLRCDAEDERQNLEINWEGNRFHLLELDSARCLDTPLTERPPRAGFDTFIGTGTGRYNGADGATVEFTFTDDGEPGTGDHAVIVVRDASGTVVLEVSGGYLTFGNHQAHRR